MICASTIAHIAKLTRPSSLRGENAGVEVSDQGGRCAWQRAIAAFHMPTHANCSRV
jgi:hypothetical protein